MTTRTMYVEIKEATFSESGMDFLNKLAAPGEVYEVVGTVGDKLLIVTDSNEFVELYPRKCKYVPCEDLDVE
jgi:hypothetical protein